MTRTTPLASLAIAITVAALPAAGEERDGDPLTVLDYRYCDSGDRERLSFLERRLDDNASYARLWWHSWNAIYVLGIGVGSASAVIEHDDRGARANAIATAAKGVIGLTRGLWSPPTAKEGTEDLLRVHDAESCHERLVLAEERLRKSAEEAHDERWGWIPHAANFALNASAAVIVAEEYDYDAAYWSGGLGLAMGELRLWTFPWHAQDDLEEYERRFAPEAGPVTPETSWGIEPWSSGARVVVRW